MSRSPRKYSIILGRLTLSARETDDPLELDVRIVRRPPGALFEHALIIRPGTILKLTTGRATTRFVKVSVFIPRMHYNGRPIAGGILRLESPQRAT